ncbi:hypothetical protein [Nitrospira sp. Nam74]
MKPLIRLLRLEDDITDADVVQAMLVATPVHYDVGWVESYIVCRIRSRS